MPRRRSRDRPWVLIFVLLSLLAHLLFVLTILVVSRLFPTPKLESDAQLASTTISLEPPPPEQPPPQPKPRRMFVPTTPDKDALKTPQQIESEYNTRLKTQSQTARDPNSIMPDVVAKHEKANLQQAPNAPSTNPPNPATTSANGKDQQQQKTAQQPPQPSKQVEPKPEQAQQPSPTTAPKPSTVPPVKAQPTVAQQQLDPNGLPVLPPIAAPTMAPASEHQEATPAASIPQIQQSEHGAIGVHGDDSPAAMATEFGRYKAKVYRAIGSQWYPKVNKQFQVMPVGVVHIQFTIHSDGRVDTKVLDGNQGALQILLSVSLNSIIEAAPFDPFTDSLKKEIAQEEGNDGERYTDDCNFSIYGAGE